MKEKREKRLNSELKRLIYEILTTKVKNPNISEMFSVTSVNVSNDLEHATVFVSVFSTNAEKAKNTFEAITEEAGAVRRELGRVMHIRCVPELHFKLDESAAYGEKIDKIISGFTYGEHDEQE